MTDFADKIIVGLDVRGARQARDLIEQLPRCSIFKIGPHFLYDMWAPPELFHHDYRDGGVNGVRTNPRWFADHKFFDIPATVTAGVHNLSHHYNQLTGLSQFMFTTVHAHIATMQAAVAGAEGTDLKVLAVPLMTSFDEDDLAEFYNFASHYAGSILDFVVERTRWAVDCGCAGIICSAQEVRFLRGNVVPKDFLLVVPGTRLPASDTHDHKRTGTPAQAMEDGADYLVLSRSIIFADNPEAAFDETVASIAAG